MTLLTVYGKLKPEQVGTKVVALSIKSLVVFQNTNVLTFQEYYNAPCRYCYCFSPYMFLNCLFNPRQAHVLTLAEQYFFQPAKISL